MALAYPTVREQMPFESHAAVFGELKKAWSRMSVSRRNVSMRLKFSLKYQMFYEKFEAIIKANMVESSRLQQSALANYAIHAQRTTGWETELSEAERKLFSFDYEHRAAATRSMINSVIDGRSPSAEAPPLKVDYTITRVRC